MPHHGSTTHKRGKESLAGFNHKRKLCYFCPDHIGLSGITIELRRHGSLYQTRICSRCKDVFHKEIRLMGLKAKGRRDNLKYLVKLEDLGKVDLKKEKRWNLKTSL